MPETTKPHPILPRLTKSIQNFTNPGTWETRGPEMVKDVADGLEVPDRSYDLKSIPDVWARALLFESVLYSKSEPTRTQIVDGEWRGLLAILALRQMRGLGTISFAPVFGSAERTSFIQVAEWLLPDRLVNPGARAQWENSSIHQATSWSDVSIILLDGNAIGMTCPTTLVISAADYTDKLNSQRIPWFRDGRIQSPKKYLSAPEQKSLSDWLFTLHDELMGAGASGPKWINLSSTLKRYISDLTGQAAPELLKLQQDIKVAGPAFVALGSAIPPAGPRKSDVELLCFRDAAPARGALILEEDAARQWKKSLVDINVHRTLPLEAALHGKDPKQRDVVAGIPLGNADWYEARDFFTDVVYVFTAKVFPGAKTVAGEAELRLGGKPASLILPIRKKWLNWLTSEELAKRVRVKTEGDSVSVSLTLPLKGGDLTINRTYVPAEIKDCGFMVPVCKVWPFIGSTSWKSFYTYYDNGGNTRMAMLEPWTNGPAESGRRLFSHKDYVVIVWQTASIPEAMVAGYENREAGIIPLESPKPAPAASGYWNVGVDFGTTGTAVFYRLKSQPEGAPLSLQKRLHSVTDEPPEMVDNTYLRFLPSLEEDAGSLLSIYHDFRVTDPKVANAIEPLTEGHIAFIQDVKTFLKFSGDIGNITTNLKWGGVRERGLALAFLRQISLQVCAEAASAGIETIGWRFSFPTAFSTKDLQDFNSIWKKVVETSTELTGIQHATDQGKEIGRDGTSPFIYKNESVSAAHCFLVTEKAFLRDGAVCIDIGGGTTDIAVWQDNRVASQCSFRFAGRDLFLHPLFRRSSILETFGCESAIFEAAKPSGEYVFHSLVDVLLKRRKSHPGNGKNNSSNGDFAMQMLDHLAVAMGDPAVAEFVGLLEFGIAGILHYVGLVLRALEAEKRFRRFMPNIYIGGNGSKILHWCASGSYRSGGEVDRKFKTIFARATDFRDFNRVPFQIVLSRAPKSEVAHGLVLDIRERVQAEEMDYFAEVEANPPLLAGEAFRVGQEKHEWNSYVSKADDLSQASVDPELPQLSALLKNVGRQPEPGLLRQTAGSVNNEFDQLTMEEQERRAEPIFITVLKTAYEALVDQWASAPEAQTGKAYAHRS